MKKRIISIVLALSMIVGVVILIPFGSIISMAQESTIVTSYDDIPLRLYYDEEAPYGNETLSESLGSSESLLTQNLDDGWERWSIPLGNGYFGANVFGRTESERIQLTEKTLANPYSIIYNGKSVNLGGLNNFSETYIDFGHTNSDVTNYSRELDLKGALSTVNYTYGGVEYSREYFTSYPDNAMVIRLDSSTDGALSFVLRPTIPYEQEYMQVEGDGGSKTGTVTSSVEGGVGCIELSGVLGYFDVDFVGLYRVYTDGNLTAETVTNADGDTDGTIRVSGATSAYIVITLGTDYELSSEVFTSSDASKPTQSTTYDDAKTKVQGYLDSITALTDGLSLDDAYALLKSRHTEDYTNLFGRVGLSLGCDADDFELTTDELLSQYKANGYGTYLETLYFQYGRYLLIASSRSGALPANLQGTWNRYNITPWSGGYWHNINVQMNYWPAFTTNLAETFESYAEYNEAYMAQAENGATGDINSFISQGLIDSSVLGADGGNGWSIDTGAYPYTVWGHQRNGVGNLGFTTQMFWDYYQFTGDKALLSDVVYPILASAARYITKVVALDETGEYYLVVDTDSPEQYVDDVWYYTNGTAYAQSFAFLNNYYCLEAARELGIDLTDEALLSTAEYSILKTVMAQLDKYDPIVIGLSGQVKEFREEDYYGDLGEAEHRHISQLVGLYPGNLINSTTPAWLDAARVVLTERGDEATGWGVAHRINLWARTKDGDRAHDLVKQLLSTNTATNLWDLHPPFQIDGNLGGTAGIAEMLLQSHEGFIAPLTALPPEWSGGSYEGLVARGDFEIGAEWSNGRATRLSILSNNGECATVYYPGIEGASIVRASDGSSVSYSVVSDDTISFETEIGESYTIEGFSEVAEVSAVESVNIDIFGLNDVSLDWEDATGVSGYNVYVARDNASTYTKIASVTASEYNIILDDNSRYTFKVCAFDENGNEGEGALCYRNPSEALVNEVEALISDESSLQVTVNSSDTVGEYYLYRRQDSASEWSLVDGGRYPILYDDEFNSEYHYGIGYTDIYGVEYAIEEFTISFVIEESENIFEGHKFVGEDEVLTYIWSPYNYDNLTNGDNTMFAIQSGKAGSYVDGTLTLSQPATLTELRIFDHYPSSTTANYMGSALTVEVLSRGVWTAVVDCDDNIEILSYRSTYNGVQCLIFPLDNVRAEAVRIYIPACYTMSNGSKQYVGINEIECSGTFINEDTDSNVLLGLDANHVTLSGATIHPGASPITNVCDGSKGTRYATLSETVAGTNTVTFTLDSEMPLYTLKIYDWRHASDDKIDGVLATRSNETTVELYSGGEWITVIDAKPLSVADTHTIFDLGGISASGIRITFSNTRSFDNGSMPSATINEIECTTANPTGEYIDRGALVDALSTLEGIEPSTSVACNVRDEAFTRFKREVMTLGLSASEITSLASEIASYTESLTLGEFETVDNGELLSHSENDGIITVILSVIDALTLADSDAYVLVSYSDGTELMYPTRRLEKATDTTYALKIASATDEGDINVSIVASDSSYSAPYTIGAEDEYEYAFTYITSVGVSTDTDDFVEALTGAGAGGVINLNRDAEYTLTSSVAGNAYGNNITINLNGFTLTIWQGDASGAGNGSTIYLYNRTLTFEGRGADGVKNGQLRCMQKVGTSSGEGNSSLFRPTGTTAVLTLNNVDTYVGCLWFNGSGGGNTVRINGGVHNVFNHARDGQALVATASSFTFEANDAIFHVGQEAVTGNTAGAVVSDQGSQKSTFTFNNCVFTRPTYTKSFIKFAHSQSYFYFYDCDIGCGINPDLMGGTASTSENFILGAGTRFWGDYTATKGYTLAEGCSVSSLGNPADKYTFTKLKDNFATATETSVTVNLNNQVICNHIDESSDGLCDYCGECLGHRDENADDVCDACGEGVDIPECQEHTDENGNLSCDICGAVIEIPLFTYTTSAGVSTDTDDFVEALKGAGANGVINLNRNAEYTLTATVAQDAYGNNITINLNGYDLIIWQGDANGVGNTSRIQNYGRAITINGRAPGSDKNGRLLCTQLVFSYGLGEGNYPLFESTGGASSLVLNNVDTTIGALWYTGGNAGSSVTINGGIHDISLVSRNSFGWVGAAAAFTFEANDAIFHMGLEAVGLDHGGAIVADRASAISTYTFNDCVITRYSYTSSFIKYATSSSYFYFNDTDIGCGINPDVYSGCEASTSANFILGAGTRFWGDYVTTKGYTLADGCQASSLGNPADKYTFTKLKDNFATATETSVTVNLNNQVKMASFSVNYHLPDGTVNTVTVNYGTVVDEFMSYTKPEDVINGWVRIIYDGGWSMSAGGSAVESVTVTETVDLYPSVSEKRAYMSSAKYNLALYGNIEIRLYIPVSGIPDGIVLGRVYDEGMNEIISLGETSGTNGVDYSIYGSDKLAITDLFADCVYIVEFTYLGESFAQRITLSPSTYAKQILEGNAGEYGKCVVADMVRYANSVYSFANSADTVIDEELTALADEYNSAIADSESFTQGEMGDIALFDEYFYSVVFDITNFEPSYIITFKDGARVKSAGVAIDGAYISGDDTFYEGKIDVTLEINADSDGYITSFRTTGISVYNIDKPLTIAFTVIDANGIEHTLEAEYTLNDYYVGMSAGGGVTEADITRARDVLKALRSYALSSSEYRFSKDSANSDKSLVSKVRTVYYSDYGAEGDGVTDDFYAIQSAHNQANALANEGYEVTVKAVGITGNSFYIKNLDTSASYYGTTIEIKTDTDWTGATIIIDDTAINESTYATYSKAFTTPIFTLRADYITSTENFHCHWMIGNSSYAMPTSDMIYRFENGLLNASLRYNSLPEITSEKVLVKIVDANHRNYVRYGGNYSDMQQEEVVLMDVATGAVDSSTPLMFDYYQVSRYEIYDAGCEPITLKGGTLITKYNNAFNSSSSPNYCLRGIKVERSNSTIKGLTQEYDYTGTTASTGSDSVTNATVPSVKASPMRLIDVVSAYNVTLSGLSIYGGRHYNYASSGLGVGNYTIHANYSVALNMNNITQQNITYEYRQPVMATNYCKNILFTDNIMSRFDSHMGLYNVDIRRSTLEAINLIGEGDAVIEDTTVNSAITGCVVTLRDDYGSHWGGDIYFNNLTVEINDDEYVALLGLAYHNYNTGYNYSTGYFSDGTTTDSYFSQDTSDKTSGRYYASEMPENIVVNGITLTRDGTEVTSGATLSLTTQFVGKANMTYTHGGVTYTIVDRQLHEYQGDISSIGTIDVGTWDEGLFGIRWSWSDKTTLNITNPYKGTESVTINGLSDGIGYCEYYDFGTDELHTFDLIFLDPTVTINGESASWTPTGDNM